MVCVGVCGARGTGEGQTRNRRDPHRQNIQTSESYCQKNPKCSFTAPLWTLTVKPSKPIVHGPVSAPQKRPDNSSLQRERFSVAHHTSASC